jgi:hypothetical protein
LHPHTANLLEIKKQSRTGTLFFKTALMVSLFFERTLHAKHFCCNDGKE